VVARKLPAALRHILNGLPGLAVAFSGGLDSRFLCHAARLCGCEPVALHAQGPHMAAAESMAARGWAQTCGLKMLSVPFDPLPLPEVAVNSRERCYACKRGLIRALRERLRTHGLQPLPLCDGSNADDTRAFRPGLRALAEAGVRSPLAEAGLGKAEIHALAAETGLDRPDQQARPCLLTRLAYGIAPSASALASLAAAETALMALPGMSAVGDFRLRLTPAPVLQLTALPESLRPRLKSVLDTYGFAGCRLQTVGQVSGFYDSMMNDGQT